MRLCIARHSLMVWLVFVYFQTFKDGKYSYEQRPAQVERIRVQTMYNRSVGLWPNYRRVVLQTLHTPVHYYNIANKHVPVAADILSCFECVIKAIALYRRRSNVSTKTCIFFVVASSV
jgi:hypothetical protein